MSGSSSSNSQRAEKEMTNAISKACEAKEKVNRQEPITENMRLASEMRISQKKKEIDDKIRQAEIALKRALENLKEEGAKELHDFIKDIEKEMEDVEKVDTEKKEQMKEDTKIAFEKIQNF